MIFRNIARILAVVLIGAGALVACSDDQQACAATAGSLSKPSPPRPGSQRTSSKVQDRPMKTSGSNPGSSKKATTNPYWRTSTKPSTWGGYNTGGRNWSQPYRKNMPLAPQPAIVNYYGRDYRSYPSYPGYYPVGVWPEGYGARYGCVADRESTPEPTGTPTPSPTATVTITVEPTTTPTASATRSGTAPPSDTAR